VPTVATLIDRTIDEHQTVGAAPLKVDQGLTA